MGINNAERFPSRILSSTFPLSQGAAYWQARTGEYWDRFVIHLAEGVNADALDEFATWQSLAALDERTTIIHGVALGASEWAALAAADGHLVWSPRSNLTLYGATADIPAALAAGVNVALAPDWTESGSVHLLAEMKYAREVGDSLWGGVLTPQVLAEMVTRNAADALGASGRIGRIQTGCRADLVVVPGSAAAPYDALLLADPGDVALTVVSGRPMAGDPSLMAQFPFLADTEDIVVDGATKRLAVRIVSHAISDSDVATADVIAALEAAYAASAPPICCFLGLEPDSCARAPVARGDGYDVIAGGTLVVDAPGVLTNDFDGDGDSLTAVAVDGPTHGAFTLAPDGGFVYEHDGSLAETDTFSYRARDGALDSEPAAVVITILDPTGAGGTPPRLTEPGLQVHPNPFNPSVTITVQLPRRGRVDVSVYDVAGRRVVALADAVRRAGTHSLTWDGRDARGRAVPSGVYLVRMQTDRSVVVRKAVLVK
jgi:hypothetical protein